MKNSRTRKNEDAFYALLSQTTLEKHCNTKFREFHAIIKILDSGLNDY